MCFVRKLTSSFADHSFVILAHTYKTYENDALGLEFF